MIGFIGNTELKDVCPDLAPVSKKKKKKIAPSFGKHTLQRESQETPAEDSHRIEISVESLALIGIFKYEYVLLFLKFNFI